MLDIQRAEDLPRLKNMTRTGWDMDPFVVVSFGKKVFRTRVIRHSRSPVWDEKLLFHVRRWEVGFKIQLTILDWDKLSSNDYIGDAHVDVGELVKGAVQPGADGLYAEGALESQDISYTLPLTTSKQAPWEAHHTPTITLRAKYQPYAALRQKFWRQYLKGYDTDDTGALSHVEITSMLDSLGSTLRGRTVDGFFTRFGKRPHEDELSMGEAIRCLEEELGRPVEEKRIVVGDTPGLDTPDMTPVVSLMDSKGKSVHVGEVDFGEEFSVGAFMGQGGYTETPEAIQGSGYFSSSETDDSYASDASEAIGDDAGTTPQNQSPAAQSPGANQSQGSASAITLETQSFERVINIRTCPLCHRPRLNDKAEVDIVTHLAVCASADWGKVDRIVNGNFVTASQAQRKWYTRIISKVGAGDYRLGANSANIIVQNRMTGQLEEEKMQVYVRLGIRLLYKGAKSRMEGGRARRLLKSLSIKQGLKYDSPESAAEIPAFIAFHGLDVGEVELPLGEYKTFNSFFYRKLKPTARPLETPDDPYRLVSAADCRFMAFESISDATKIWIKGREFGVGKLLNGETTTSNVDPNAPYYDPTPYLSGTLCIFRLAPQDYHRFHSPVKGVVGKMKRVEGEYYTVNPQAIRTTLDVYGDNVRKVVPIHSEEFGVVMCVCVGAMMVGSIETTVEEGQDVERGDEFGYFAFGGSTIVILFEKGRVTWDEDLVVNGKAAVETLVRVGMGIGRGASPSASPS
ncbi:phosphatidylserine decarboxylase-domain-containing protein [Mycena floridula]|nr:phosphatidylserine decarboxylase-domain-containing protein [Mycena floridula]